MFNEILRKTSSTYKLKEICQNSNERVLNYLYNWSTVIDAVTDRSYVTFYTVVLI